MTRVTERRFIALRMSGDEISPLTGQSKGAMDLAITGEQFAAVRAARHLPDVLKKVLDGARRVGDGYVLHLTYEEATALNELCAWHVHTDESGAVTPESRVYDDLVKAILTHPDY